MATGCGDARLTGGGRTTLHTRAGLVASILVSIGLLLGTNVLALRQDLFPGEAGGFIVFVNVVGLMAVSAMAVGVLIRWRVPGHAIAVPLIAGALLLQTVFLAWPLIVAGQRLGLPPSMLGIVALWANLLLAPALFLLFPVVGLLFPDGRLPGPGWRRPLAAVVLLLGIGTALVAIAPWTPTEDLPVANPIGLAVLPPVTSEVGGALAAISLFAAQALSVAAIATRFRRSQGVERAQMKWLVAALALMGLVFPVSFATDVGPAELIDVASALVGSLMPIAIGIAILRYRLYAIDRLISRTVSWAAISTVVLGIFGGLVVGLQTLLDDVTQGDTLAVAASTLVAFACFQPIRRWVQRTVDRAFDRGRYDMEGTAAAFAEQLREDITIGAVAHDLDATVRRSVRPERIGIWLRDAPS